MDETNYLSNTAIYCADRTAASETPWGVDGSNKYYSAYKRLSGPYDLDNEFYIYKGNDSTPSLDCPVNNDRFTVSSKSGNGALEYPIALITADEVAYAGSVFGDYIIDYYLSDNAKTGAEYWWTMTPGYWNSSGNFVGNLIVGGSKISGALYPARVLYELGIRPVTSLKSCVTWSSGNGTASDPYEVELSSECASLDN